MAFIIPSYYPAYKYGGPIISTHLLNKTLIKKGIDITVYTTTAGVEDYREFEILDGVKVFRFPYIKYFDVFVPTSFSYSPKMKKKFAQDAHQFDIVYITPIFNWTTLMGSKIALEIKKPYIISPRGSLYPFTLKKKGYIKKFIFYHIFLKKYINRAAAIHYTSIDEKEQTHNFLKIRSKPIIISNGIDLKEYSIHYSKENFLKRFPHLKNKILILFLGRINWKKGLDLLIEAFANLVRKPKYKNLHLILAGEDDGDDYKLKIKNLITQKSIENHVTFTGLITGRDKLAVLHAADIFILPSYSENFGMSVVEAMACKKPVIISNKVGIYREIKEFNAGLVVSPNSYDLMEAMIKLIENKSSRKRLGENAYRLVKEKFDIEKVADEFIKVIEYFIK